ncbi:MAG: substrate-binding domain-containing protein, partial [Myxococcota bacterium]
LAGTLAREGFRVKVLAVGSRAGLEAAMRGECDVAPVHLLDPETGEYNRPFLSPDMHLVSGYGRMQGVITRKDDRRDLKALLSDPEARMVNRNRGAGTRILIDRLLDGRCPPGHAYEPRSHHAVAAAVAQGRSDWGVTISNVARQAGLRFSPLQAERYDFVIPAQRWQRPAVVRLRELLEPGSDLRRSLAAAGFDSE